MVYLRGTGARRPPSPGCISQSRAAAAATAPSAGLGRSDEGEGMTGGCPRMKGARGQSLGVWGARIATCGCPGHARFASAPLGAGGGGPAGEARPPCGAAAAGPRAAGCPGFGEGGGLGVWRAAVLRLKVGCGSKRGGDDG